MKKSGFMADFKKFITKGNVVDMAIGVIIGNAFSKIVSSLVNDVIMPFLGMLLGEINFTELKCVLKPEVLDAEGNVTTAAVTVNYGQFIQYVVDFLLVALCIFVALRVVTNLTKKLRREEEKEAEVAPAPEPAPEPQPSKEELLLTEIRDLLKTK